MEYICLDPDGVGLNVLCSDPWAVALAVLFLGFSVLGFIGLITEREEVEEEDVACGGGDDTSIQHTSDLPLRRIRK